MAHRRAEEDEEAEGPRPLTEAQGLRELRAIYRAADAAYAPHSCPASGECCQLAVTRRQPWLWPPEWRLLRAGGRPLPPPREDGACPFLDAAGKRCTVYADRPFGCRTFFCGRRRGPASEPTEDVVELSLRLEHLSERMGSAASAPRELLDLYRGALAEHGRKP